VFVTLFGNNFSLLVRLLVFCFLSASQFLSCLITEWGPQAFQNRIVLTWRRKRTKLATLEIGTSSLIWSLFRSYHLNFNIVLICSKRTLSSSSWEKGMYTEPVNENCLSHESFITHMSIYQFHTQILPSKGTQLSGYRLKIQVRQWRVQNCSIWISNETISFFIANHQPMKNFMNKGMVAVA
jgi:hypothetical protein